MQTTAKEILKGYRMDYLSMEASLVALNIDHIRAHLKKEK